MANATTHRQLQNASSDLTDDDMFNLDDLISIEVSGTVPSILSPPESPVSLVSAPDSHVVAEEQQNSPQLPNAEKPELCTHDGGDILSCERCCEIADPSYTTAAEEPSECLIIQPVLVDPTYPTVDIEKDRLFLLPLDGFMNKHDLLAKLNSSRETDQPTRSTTALRQWERQGSSCGWRSHCRKSRSLSCFSSKRFEQKPPCIISSLIQSFANLITCS
mmetsp:Transcript_10716/g.17556  ORF Transcript_10716/g.17556 Transcript_10716/m.17556 type:complete len:218 (-) Transcript_10716:670-1323(-)